MAIHENNSFPYQPSDENWLGLHVYILQRKKPVQKAVHLLTIMLKCIGHVITA
jgi:hypothetical protein